MRLTLPLALLGCFFFSGTAYGQKRIYVNEYLNIGVGARGLGMAGRCGY